MNWIRDKHFRILAVLGLTFLSGCKADSSAGAQMPKVVKAASCQSTDKKSSDFWDCEESKKLRFNTFLDPESLSIKLRDGEFYLSRDLGHLDDPDFQDLLIVSDSLPYLVGLVCSDSLEADKIKTLNEIYADSSAYEMNVRMRRSINEDPNVYEWRVEAENVYSSLNKYCL